MVLRHIGNFQQPHGYDAFSMADSRSGWETYTAAKRVAAACMGTDTHRPCAAPVHVQMAGE